MKISLQEFKNQVISDYKLVTLGSECAKIAVREESSAGLTLNADVAQVALAKFLTTSDTLVTAAYDLTLQLSAERTRPEQFFLHLFANNQPLPVNRNALLDSFKVSQRTENEGVTVCTIGNESLESGALFGVLHEASKADIHMPLSIIFWNTGIVQSNANLLKMLSIWLKDRPQEINIQAVSGDDYAALCTTFQSQLRLSRQGCTTLTLVELRGNPSAFATWISQHDIASPSDLHAIDQAATQAAETSLRGVVLR